jgi:hypothetical protein
MKNVSCAFRRIYVLSIIQTLIERQVKFTVEPDKGNDFIVITVDGFITPVEAFPEHLQLVAYRVWER